MEKQIDDLFTFKITKVKVPNVCTPNTNVTKIKETLFWINSKKFKKINKKKRLYNSNKNKDMVYFKTLHTGVFII